MTESLSRRIASLTPEQRRRLAERLRRADGEPTEPGPGAGLAPLSYAQERLWFLDSLNPGDPAYNIAFAVRLTGHLDRSALEKSLRAVASRHDALRTRFADTEHGPRQKVAPDAAPGLVVTDLRESPDQQPEAARVAGDHAKQRFNLVAGPVLAVRLLCRADNDHLLLVCVHHIVFDGWSSEVFVADLVRCYGQFASRAPGEIPRPLLRFAEHAAAERRGLTGEALGRHLAYWRNHLAGAPVLSTVPPDHPRPATLSHHGRQRPLIFPPELSRALTDRTRSEGTTLNVVILAAVATTVYGAGAARDIVLGMPVAGRTKVGLESVIGCFANTLVIRTKVGDGDSARELIRRAHRTMSAAYAHQVAPYAHVVETLAPARDRGHNPLFQIMVSVNEITDASRSAAGVGFTPQGLDSGYTDFDIFMTLQHAGDELSGALTYSTDLYLDETIDSFIASLHEVLTEFAMRPECRVADLAPVRRRTVAIVASFTADPVHDPIRFWSRFLRSPVNLEAVPYGQVVQQLVNGPARDATVTYLRWEDWLRHWAGDRAADFLDEVLADLVRAVVAFRARTDVPLLLVVCPATPQHPLEDVFGRLDDWLARRMARVPGVEVAFAAERADQQRAEDVFDGGADELGRVPYTPEFFAALGTLTYRRLSQLWGDQWPAAGSERADIAGHLTDAAVADRVRLRRACAPGGVGELAVAPKTPAERRLAALWEETLRVTGVGVTSDFFALGGHSLLATRLVSKIRSAFRHDLSLHAFLTHPTIEALARILDATGPRGEPSSAIIPVLRGSELVPSATQKRMWALARLGDAPAAHNTAYAMRLVGDLDENALLGAMAAIISRHEVLRMSFPEQGGRPTAVVHDDVDPWLPTVDLRQHGLGEREPALRAVLERDAAEKYDLEQGPLLRARLIRDADDVHCLLIGMHHAVCDDWSWGVFLSELAALYGTAVTGGTAVLEPLPVQFADFAAWQESWLASTDGQRQVQFWRNLLRSAPPVLNLRAAAPRPPRRTGCSASVTRVLAPALASAVAELSQQEGVTTFMTLLAGLAVTLYRGSGQDDLVVGTPSRGRNHPETEHLIGYFADLLPFLITMRDGPTFRQLLKRVRRTVLEAMAHQDVPFSAIVDAVHPPRSPAHHPLFQYVINFLDRQQVEPGLPGLTSETIDIPVQGTDFDMFLSVIHSPEGLEVVATYAADLFDAPAAEAFLGSFEAAMQASVALPDAPLGLTTDSSAVAEDGGLMAAVAASFPAERVRSAVGLCSHWIGVPIHVSPHPVSPVFRAMVDPGSRFGQTPAALGVVLFRWQDFLDASVAPMAAVVWEAEEALADLVRSVAEFRGRSGMALLLVACPASAEWNWMSGVFGSLDDRLVRQAVEVPGVEVVLASSWARRQGAGEAYPPGNERGHGAFLPGFLDCVAELAVRRILHHGGYSPTWVALDPAGWPRLDLLRFAAGQSHYGRLVVVAAGERTGAAAGDLDALSRIDGVRLLSASLVRGLPELVAQGAIDPGAGLVLAADAHAQDEIQRLLPRGGVVAVPAPPGDKAKFLASCWPLDEPAGPARPGVSRSLADLAAIARPAEVAEDRLATELEQLFADVWADLLHVERVGLHDDFFALGGDSMLAIEAAYRAVEAGVVVTPRQIVDNPTVAALSASTTERPPAGVQPGRSGKISAGPGDEVPISPSQHWFLASVAPRMSAPAHFNHPYYLQLNRAARPEIVEQAWNELASAHDSLRLRLRRDGTGGWHQSCGPVSEGIPFESHDLSGLPAAERESAVASLMADSQRGLDLGGPLARTIHVRLGPDGGDRVLLVAHHLVTDGLSREILLEDMRRLLLDLPRGRSPRLPASVPYITWAQQVQQYAQSARLREELPFWLSQQSSQDPGVPADLPGPVTFGTLKHRSFTLSELDTTGLLGWTRRYQLKVNDLLVWAVAEAVAEWTGRADCALAFSGHGRDELTRGMDVSRTTGWLHVLYPLQLTLPEGRGDPRSAAGIARQLALVPGTGLGWSTLRYCCEDPSVRHLMAQVPLPRMSFNYMGHFNYQESRQGGDVFKLCHEPYGIEQDPAGIALFDMDFVASMVGQRLRVEINYGINYHKQETVEWVLSRIRAHLRTAIVSAQAGTEGNQ